MGRLSSNIRTKQNAIVQNLISVIIVNFNSGDHLRFCVESILGSTIKCEIIISDNASTDQSPLNLPQHSAIRIIKQATNLGFARANNNVLSQASGEYILFLNPDCVIQPDTLAEMARILDAYPNGGMAGCLLRNSDGSEQAGCRRRIPTPKRLFAQWFKQSEPYLQNRDSLPQGPIAVEAISGAFMFVRKSALEKVGPMDEAFFMHCEDLDWCMRFRQAGFDVLFVPHVEATHVKGVSSRTRPIAVEWHKHKGMVRLYRKHFATQYSSTTQIFLTFAIWAHFIVKLSFLFLTNVLGLNYRHRSK